MKKKRKISPILLFVIITATLLIVMSLVLYFFRSKAPPFPVGVAWPDKATARRANLAQKYVGGAFAPEAMVILPEEFQVQMAAQAPTEEQVEKWSWELLRLYMQFRAENGLSPADMIAELEAAARERAFDEGIHNSFDHWHSTGDYYNKVPIWFGFLGWQSLECLAAFPVEWEGRNVAQIIFDAWKASPDHRSALLWPKTETAGIAFVWVEGSQYGLYVVFLGGYDGNSYEPLPWPEFDDLPEKIFLPLVVKGTSKAKGFDFQAAAKSLPGSSLLVVSALVVAVTACWLFWRCWQKRNKQGPLK